MPVGVDLPGPWVRMMVFAGGRLLGVHCFVLLSFFLVSFLFVRFRAFHGSFFANFFVESLILAQDERWRRA